MNKSLENKEIEVLVENKTKKGNKFFGRSEYMTSVIFDGNDQDVGNIIKVKIKIVIKIHCLVKILKKKEKRVA